MKLLRGIVSQQFGPAPVAHDGEVIASASATNVFSSAIYKYVTVTSSAAATGTQSAIRGAVGTQNSSAAATSAFNGTESISASQNASATATGTFDGAIPSTTEESYEASSSQSNPNSSNWTWNNAGIGTADASRVVLVVFCGDANKTLSGITCTIGGNSATVVYWQAGDNTIVGYAYATVGTGTTANISLVTTGGGSRWTDISASTFRLIGYNMTAESSYNNTGTTTVSTSLSTTSGATIIGGFVSDAATINWTNLTEAQEVTLNTGYHAEGYNLAGGTGGSVSVSATSSGATAVHGFFASFAPA